MDTGKYTIKFDETNFGRVYVTTGSEQKLIPRQNALVPALIREAWSEEQLKGQVIAFIAMSKKPDAVWITQAYYKMSSNEALHKVDEIMAEVENATMEQQVHDTGIDPTTGEEW